MTSFTIRPLTDHTGSEVIGLDFTGAIDNEARATLNRAFAERHVLVMRDQHFAPEQFKAAARLFGLTNIFDVTGDAKLDGRTSLAAKGLIEMKSGVAVSVKTFDDGRAEHVGVTVHVEIRPGRIDSSPETSWRCDVNCLDDTIRWINSIELKMSGATGVVGGVEAHKSVRDRIEDGHLRSVCRVHARCAIDIIVVDITRLGAEIAGKVNGAVVVRRNDDRRVPVKSIKLLAGP